MCHFQGQDCDKQENDIGDPGAEHGWKAARHGEHGGYLLQENEGERQSHAHEDVHAHAALVLARGDAQPQEGHDENADGVGDTLVLLDLEMGNQVGPTHLLFFDETAEFLVGHGFRDEDILAEVSGQHIKGGVHLVPGGHDFAVVDELAPEVVAEHPFLAFWVEGGHLRLDFQPYLRIVKLLVCEIVSQVVVAVPALNI